MAGARRATTTTTRSFAVTEPKIFWGAVHGGSKQLQRTGAAQDKSWSTMDQADKSWCIRIRPRLNAWWLGDPFRVVGGFNSPFSLKLGFSLAGGRGFNPHGRVSPTVYDYGIDGTTDNKELTGTNNLCVGLLVS